MAWYSIAKSMLPCKTVYFLLLAKEAAFRMNLVLFFASIGLSKSQAGLIVGLRLVSVIGVSPFIGMIADKYQIHRSMITLCSAITIIFTSLQPFFAYKFGSSKFLYCPTTEMNRNSTLNVTSADQKAQSSPHSSNADLDILFKVMLTVNLIQSLFDGSLDAFVDTGVMLRIKQSNENSDQKNKYGPQRIFGVLGQLIGPMIGNYSIYFFPSHQLTCYTGLFILYACLSISYLFSLIWLFHGLKIDVHATTNDEETDELYDNKKQISEKEKAREESFRTVLFRTIFEAEMFVMLLTLLAIGCLFSEILSYSFPYLKDLKASTMDLNLFLIFFSIGNLIGFMVIPKLIRLLKGPFRSLFILLLVAAIRFSLMAAFSNPILIGTVQILSIFDYPITEFVALEFIMRKSPKRVLTSMYGIVNAVQYSLSEAVGNTLGGYVYENYGAKTLFYVCSVFSAAISLPLVIWIVKRQFQEMRKSKSAQNEQDELCMVEKS